MIELSNLNIGYKHKKKVVEIFKEISLTLNLGELVGLIGDNGIGKSTLLKTITGDLLPIYGEVYLQSTNITSFSNEQLSQLISIVTTQKIGGFNLTVWDVACAGRIPYINVFGKLTSEDEAIVIDSLNQLNLMALKDKLIDELSDGQRQKVMIAKCLAQQTPIIVLDEPTAFLDYKSKHHLFSVLKKLCVEQNKLIIVSSHDLDLMNQYTSHSIIMSEGNHLEFNSSLQNHS